MARPQNILTVRKIAATKKAGRYGDGGGLYLRVTESGSQSWSFMAAVNGKRVEIGLGSTKALPLATARSIAGNMREAIAIGSDPRLVIAPKLAPEIVTFGKFAEEYISSVESGWKNPTHRQQWRNSLRDHAKLLMDKPVADINTDDVLAVLKPIWMRIPETADRVRGRIERILAAGKARGIRSADAANPAQLRGHLDILLPRQPKLSRGHHAALPYKDAPTFFAELTGRVALTARCLEFTILTAARSGEALGADWSEIDFAAQLWRVPAERMKAGVAHIVPLSTTAIDLLNKMRGDEEKPTGRIFAVSGAQRSNMAMAMLLRRMKYSNITTHGFRSTFRDWAGDCTEYPKDLIETALAHTIQNQAEAAYRREKAIERRRPLMQAWANFLTASNVAK